jgi:hypothetical protein
MARYLENNYHACLFIPRKGRSMQYKYNNEKIFCYDNIKHHKLNQREYCDITNIFDGNIWKDSIVIFRSHPCIIFVFSNSLYKKGMFSNWKINLINLGDSFETDNTL